MVKNETEATLNYFSDLRGTSITVLNPFSCVNLGTTYFKLG